MEIFFKTRRAWTCFFVNPELNFATFFFIFYFLIRSTFFLWKSDFMFRRMVFPQGYQILGADEKTKKTKATLFIRNRNLILLLHCLIFEGAWINYELRIMNYELSCYGDGKHLQKTMITLPIFLFSWKDKFYFGGRARVSFLFANPITFWLLSGFADARHVIWKWDKEKRLLTIMASAKQKAITTYFLSK